MPDRAFFEQELALVRIFSRQPIVGLALMIHSKSSSDQPSREEAPASRRAIISGRCRECGYSLRGLNRSGDCPECGMFYAPHTIIQDVDFPSAMSLIMRFGWPLAVLALFGAPVLILGPAINPERSLVCPVSIALFIMTVNALMQRWLLAFRFHTGLYANKLALPWWGFTATVVFWMSFLLPYFIFGICLVLALMT
jgi:hypothetical protein